MRLHNRLVKAEFWLDTGLIRAVPPLGRMMFLGLWQIADDSGCLADDPLGWKVTGIFSQDAEITVEMMAAWRDALVQAGMLVPYEAGGKRYLWIRNFARHQRLEKPKPPGKESVPLPPWLEWREGDSRRKRGYFVRTEAGQCPDKVRPAAGQAADEGRKSGSIPLPIDRTTREPRTLEPRNTAATGRGVVLPIESGRTESGQPLPGQAAAARSNQEAGTVHPAERGTEHPPRETAPVEKSRDEQRVVEAYEKATGNVATERDRRLIREALAEVLASGRTAEQLCALIQEEADDHRGARIRTFGYFRPAILRLVAGEYDSAGDDEEYPDELEEERVAARGPPG